MLINKNMSHLKLQNSFGRFVKFVLDPQKVDHIPSEYNYYNRM